MILPAPFQLRVAICKLQVLPGALLQQKGRKVPGLRWRNKKDAVKNGNEISNHMLERIGSSTATNSSSRGISISWNSFVILHEFNAFSFLNWRWIIPITQRILPNVTFSISSTSKSIAQGDGLEMSIVYIPEASPWVLAKGTRMLTKLPFVIWFLIMVRGNPIRNHAIMAEFFEIVESVFSSSFFKRFLNIPENSKISYNR